jgi:hypothetical protein
VTAPEVDIAGSANARAGNDVATTALDAGVAAMSRIASRRLTVRKLLANPLLSLMAASRLIAKTPHNLHYSFAAV